MVIFYSEKIRVEASTKEKVIPGKWTGSRVRATGKDFDKINQHLVNLEEGLIAIWRDNRGASASILKELVMQFIKGESPESANETIFWIENFILESKKKPATKQVYNASLQHLKNYCEKFSIKLTWDSFDLDFYESFTEYLYSIGHNDNTVGKTIKTVKTFISQAFERNLHTNLNFKKKGFRVIASDVDEIYLNEAEIIQFYNTDLEGDQELEESKKRFVFDCWVGLRFGDLSRINPNQITKGMNGGLMLKVTTGKTGEDVMIPLHPLAEEIWNAWGGKPPKSIHNSDFNAHIKVIAEKAKLDAVVQKRNTIKGVVSIEWVPKHQMVKAHTCRRSFATNCYLMGVPVQTIMAVTGHKTEKAFKKYIRITKEQHANIMMEYFKKSAEDKSSIMKVAN